MLRRPRLLLLLLTVGALVVFGGRLLLLAGASGTPDAADPGQLAALAPGAHRAGIIFGAGLNRSGEPSLLLLDRIRAGQRLLESDRVDLLIVTGDNSQDDYDEPGAMLARLVADGVPRSKIAVDYAGRRTWDSCRRARSIFGVRQAVVVTNDFHRARTVVTCEEAGVSVAGAVGTSTGPYPLSARARWRVRELAASWRGAIDAWVRQPDVAVGGETIDPYDACSVWRSLSAGDRGERPAGC